MKAFHDGPNAFLFRLQSHMWFKGNPGRLDRARQLADLVEGAVQATWVDIETFLAQIARRGGD